MKDGLYAVSLCIFFVDVVFHFSRLREGKSVNVVKKKCWGEREEKIVQALGKNPSVYASCPWVIFVLQFCEALVTFLV